MLCLKNIKNNIEYNKVYLIFKLNVINYYRFTFSLDKREIITDADVEAIIEVNEEIAPEDDDQQESYKPLDSSIITVKCSKMFRNRLQYFQNE